MSIEWVSVPRHFLEMLANRPGKIERRKGARAVHEVYVGSWSGSVIAKCSTRGHLEETDEEVTCVNCQNGSGGWAMIRAMVECPEIAANYYLDNSV